MNITTNVKNYVVSVLADDALLPAKRASLLKVDAVASELAKSKRTLQRHLKANSTTYAEILEEARKEIALTLLPRLAIYDLAERLGYRDSSCVTASFRRWFGQTPSAIKRSGLVASEENGDNELELFTKPQEVNLNLIEAPRRFTERGTTSSTQLN